MDTVNSEGQRMADLLRSVIHGEMLDHGPGEAWHGPALLGMVQDLSAAQAAKKPIRGGHSIWELVMHIGNWNEAIVRRLGGDAMEGLVNTEYDWPRAAVDNEPAWKAALTRLRASCDELEKTFASATDEHLAAPAINRKFANYVMAHGIIHHIVYHSGQIGLLRKALAEK